MNTYIKNSRKQSNNIPEFARRLNLKIHPNVFKNYIYEFIKINNISYPSELNADMKKIKSIVTNKQIDKEEQEHNVDSDYKVESSDNNDIMDDIHISNKINQSWISIGKAHIIITWLVQRILDNIIIKSINKAEHKNDAGLYIITLDIIRSIINNDYPFNEQFKIYDHKYCDNISYSSMIRDNNKKIVGIYINDQIQNDKTIKNIINEYFKNNCDVYYDEKTINYINFLLISVINDILSNIHFLLNVTNKKNMKEDIVYAAIQLVIKKVFWESINVELKQFIEDFYKIDRQLKEDRKQIKILKENEIKEIVEQKEDKASEHYEESEDYESSEDLTIHSNNISEQSSQISNKKVIKNQQTNNKKSKK